MSDHLFGTRPNEEDYSQTLRALGVGRDVGIRRITKDRYGRTVAELFVDGSNVQQQLVPSGHTEIYWKYAHQCGWNR